MINNYEQKNQKKSEKKIDREESGKGGLLCSFGCGHNVFFWSPPISKANVVFDGVVEKYSIL